MKTIVINAFSARRGGGQTYLINLLRYLDEFKGRIFILAPQSLELPDHPSIVRMKVSWPTENPLLRTLWERFKLPRLLKEIHADVLFCPGGVITSNVPKHCRTVTMFRNMIPFNMTVRKKYPLGMMRIRNWLLEYVMLSSMMRADTVIFISDYARQLVEKRAGGRLKRSVTIKHGLSDHFMVPGNNPPARPGWIPEGEYILYVSIFDVYKNQLEVVRGFHLLRQRRNAREKLLLAGDGSSNYAQLVRDEIARLGLQDDVLMIGNIAYRDLPSLYANAKINVFASTCENCPNILLEALGAGRPLLVSNCQPMPEFAGEAAIYFDPFSPEDFAAKLEAVLDDKKKMEDYEAKARSQARFYNWKESAQATWRVLESL